MKLFTQITPSLTRSASDVSLSAGKSDPYMEAVTSGDMETAQRMVARRAARTGYDKFGVVFRGQWGGEPQGVLRSFRASYSFGSEYAAKEYAAHPNDRNAPGSDTPKPAVMSVYLKIDNPFVDDGDDPFIGLSTIADKLGRDFALKTAIDFSECFTNTNNWIEDLQPELEKQGIQSYEQFIKERPDAAIESLYGDIFPMLDSHKFVERLRSVRIDGAIHGGAGLTDGETEWKTFSTNQVKLSDPVTYDKDKKPIPLNKRFDSSNPDIRY